MLPVYRLFGNIWRDLSKQNQGDSVGQLLAQGQNCTVEMLLEDEHTPTELRNNNPKLVSYFGKDKLMRLLHYIIVEPPEDADHKRGHKFPFQASELLSVEQNSIMDVFFVQTEKPKYPIKTKKHTSPSNSPCKDIQSPTNEMPEVALTPKIENESDEIELDSNGQKQTEEELEEPRESTSIPLPEAIDATPNTDDVAEQAEENKEQEAVQTEEQTQPLEDKEEVKEEQESQTQTENSEKKEETEFQTKESEPQTQEAEEKSPKEEEVKEILSNVVEQQSVESSQKVSDEELQEDKMTMITGSTYADSQDQPVEMEKRQELLDFLFSFIEDGEKELNPVLCGYFCKMVNCLLTKRGKQTLTYLFSYPQILMNMVRHMESRGIYEILMRVLRIDSSIVQEMEVELSVQKARIIDFLVDQLSGECTRWENINSATVLTQLVENSTLWSIIIQDVELLKKTVTNIVCPKSTTSVQSSLQFFTGMVSSTARIITRHQQGASLNEADVENAFQFKETLNSLQLDISEDEEHSDTDSDHKITDIRDILGKIFELLQNEPTNLVQQSYGRSIIPLGKTRLQVVRLLCCLVELAPRRVIEFIVSSRILKTLMTLVVTYEWNNLLHVLADKIFTQILDRNEPIRAHLIKEMHFADWIVELANQGSFMFDSGRFSRTGYMPFANKLSNQLNKLAESQPDIDNILKTNFAYSEYRMGDLATMNSLNTRSLGGYKTGPSGEEKKVRFGIREQDEEQKQEEEKMDSNVSFGIEEIYKEFNELSARYNSSRENSVKSEDEENDEMECPISPEGSDESPDKEVSETKDQQEEQEEEEEEDYQDHQKRFAETMKNITDEQGCFEEEEEEQKVEMKDSAVGTEVEEEEDDEFNDREEQGEECKEEENPFEVSENPDEMDCDFYSNNYWKVETQYNIDEMMKDFI